MLNKRRCSRSYDKRLDLFEDMFGVSSCALSKSTRWTIFRVARTMETSKDGVQEEMTALAAQTERETTLTIFKPCLLTISTG